MTEIVPVPPAVPEVPAPGPDAASPVDVVLAARAVSDGEYIAGLILAAELDTVGSPRKLPQDVWPDADAALIQEVFQRGVAVGFRAGRFFGAPRFYRDKLVSLQRRLAEAGYAAMARAMRPSVAVAHRAPEWHPADGEDGREHP